MEVFFKLMGVSAALGSAMSRQRVNFIPLSLLPIIALFFLPFIALALTFENGEPKNPVAVGLKAIGADEYDGPKHIAIQGKYDVDTAYTHSVRRKYSSDEYSYIAFVDSKSGGAVMVRFEGGDPEAFDPSITSLTGMLHYLDTNFNGKLPKAVGKFPLSQTYYLEAGDTPLDAGPAPLFLLLATVPFLIFAVAWMRQYVVFRPDRSDASIPPSAQPVELNDVRATGRFFLDPKTSERFLAVPALLGGFDDGSLGLYANVDASTTNTLYFIPLGKNERSGYWLIWMGRGTVKDIQRGRQYLGWDSRPALRFTYKSGYARTSESAVVSFGSEQERESMLASLQSVRA